jgi:SOS response regulatory protein OraA/RecX
MAAEMAAKGVDREAARAALEGLDAEDQLNSAVELARRMVRSMPGEQADLQRVGARLLRRGFPMEVARAALRKV